MHIVSLSAENFKRLKAVRITPNGSTVVIGGANAQGKSSVLDAISAALGGADAAPDQPVRIGAESGAVVIDLGDITVRRTFSVDGKSTLTVTSKDGAKFSSPQAMLDKLIGRLSFDPLAFARQDPKAQAATLKQLLGLDFTAQDAERARIYAERTAIGAEGKRAEAHAKSLPAYPTDTPDAEVSISDLLAQLQAAQEHNAKIDALRRRVAKADADRAAIQSEISDLEAKLANAKERLEGVQSLRAATEAMIDGVKPIDIVPLQTQVASAEGINRAVRTKQQSEAALAMVAKCRGDWATKTAQIEAIDKAKADAIAAAPMPVPGMSFNENGVLLNGVPFSQASSAEQLRTSVAMGLAMNPKLKVILIRDASLLDERSMALVAEEAEKAGAQVWMERVTGDKAGCQVLIEDGEVAK